MADKKAIHPLVDQELIDQAREHFRPDVSDAEIAECLSNIFGMLADWAEPEVQ